MRSKKCIKCGTTTTRGAICARCLYRLDTGRDLPVSESLEAYWNLARADLVVVARELCDAMAWAPLIHCLTKIGMSRSEIAQATGLRWPDAVSRWMSGTSLPTGARRAKLRLLVASLGEGPAS